MAVPDRLVALKAYRRRIYSPGRGFGNVIRRKAQTWNSGLPKLELLAHLVKLLRHDLACRLGLAENTRPLPLPAGTRLLIVAKISGGIGDLILASRFLRQLSDAHDVELAIECRSPELASFAMASSPRLLQATSRTFKTSDPRCVCVLHMGNLITVEFIGERASSALREQLRRANAFLEPYRPLIDASPFLDGILGDILTAAHIHRHDACFAQFGIPYSHEDFLRPEPATVSDFVATKSLIRNRYITIADGWDAAFGFLNGRRPTKALPQVFLTDLVAELKRQRPDLAIVQLGGSNTGSDIPCVDRNFRGAIGLPESALLLAGALLHVDTEGGLVHLARAVGTPAAVFFGPTHPEFFSYEGNVALLPAEPCLNCYWSTNTWMAICPLRKPKICTETHSVPVASAKILTLAGDRQGRC